jgi:hypothetical protein
MENMEDKKIEQEEALFSESAIVAQAPSSGADRIEFDIVVNSDGQLSLFGPDPEKAAKDEEKKGKGVASTKSVSKAGKGTVPKPPSPPPQRKFEKVPLNDEESWTVHYAGQTYIVNTLFEEEIADGKTEATLDEIREKLATMEGCVELTQARTRWDSEEGHKRLFPVAYGTSKGCC